jgi:D-glycero-alpha-D-manno-heptose-7-phosphate kinase
MILARAPLRIALGGGGTDLPSYYREHGGFILSAAIDKYVYVALNRPPADDLIRVKYSAYEEVATTAEIQHDLVRPALQLLGIDSNIEIASMADVPAGTGLGSSSTYLVALLTALHELTRERCGPQELAELAFQIEEGLAGHPVGKQDHYAASFGGIVALEIGRDGKVEASRAPIPLAVEQELNNQTLLFFTCISRSANGILEQQKCDSIAADANVVGSLHQTKEIGYRILDALERGALSEFGALLHEHWENKKRRSAGITADSVDRWYAAAREAGAAGGKLVGAGGGGFLLLFCENGAKADVRATLAEEGLREMSYRIDHQGAKVLVNF